MSSEDNKLLNTEEVAAMLRLPKATVLIYCHQRKIQYYKIGRFNQFKLSDVEAFIESRRRPALNQK